MSEQTEMHIFFASDNNYATPLCCAIASILRYAKQTDFHNFYILENNISKENKEKINKLKKIKDFNIEYITVDNKLFEKYPITEQCKHITKETYYRYIIPQIKSNLEKVLYLDCDLTVVDTLADLWNTDLSDKYCGVVQDIYSLCQTEDAQRLGLSAYFNAGVILINNKKWCKEDIGKKLFEKTIELYNSNNLIWQDQDALNYTFKENVIWLNPRFNYQQNGLDNPCHTKYTNGEMIFAKKNPVIIHWNNARKPWNLNCKLYANEYYKNLWISGYYKEIFKLLRRWVFSIQKQGDRRTLMFFGIKTKI